MDTKLTAEEIAAEQVAIQAPKEDEVRADIIKEFGFDETADAERIDKLTKREIEQRTRLSTAIGQKIKHRTDAEELRGKLPKDESKLKEGEGKKDDLSSTDLYALMTAQVPQEDIEEVQKASKLLGKSIAETLKDETFSAVLKTRQEHRKTAEAASTKPPRPGTKQITDEQLLKDASEGKVPEKGTAAAEELFWAKRGGKRK